MFKRKIYEQLIAWKTRGNSALLIEGAKGVGKTTIAQYFGQNEFPDYLLIDFSTTSKGIKDLFNNLSNIDAFFERFFLALSRSPLKEGSLIIFDEVEFCPKARQAIKPLVKDGRYYYLETGSLVGIKENTKDILIPSEEEILTMFPLDYEEFLWAQGHEYQAFIIKEHFVTKIDFDPPIHQKLSNDFRLYLAIGGMPKVVDTYLTTRNYNAVELEKRKILQSYLEDLEEIDKDFKTITSQVYQQIPSMLSHPSSRFKVSSVSRRGDSISFLNTMDKLIESKLVLPVYKCQNPSSEFSFTKEKGAFKLYFNDVGLLTSWLSLNSPQDHMAIYQKLILTKSNEGLNLLFENVVAQQLYANGYEPFYYSWKEDNKRYEIDFLIHRNGKTIPFEVKSRNVSSKTSLEEFKKKFLRNIGDKYIVSNKPYKKEDTLIYLPYYSLFALS